MRVLSSRLLASLMLCLSLGASFQGPRGALAEEPKGDPDLYLETMYFKDRDSNADGVLSKKEFYYAIMEESFEEMADKHAVSAVDLEFEAQDLNGDGVISLFEWKKVFIHDLPQEAEYVDGEAQGTPTPAPQPDPNAGQGIAVPGESMQLTGDKKMPDGRTFYMAEDGSWLRIEGFCKEKESRLCKYDELCPDILQHHGEHFSPEEIVNRWVPVQGPAHEWMELRNCGLARWPDWKAHSSLIACCVEEDKDLLEKYRELMKKKQEEETSMKAEQEEKQKLEEEEAQKLEAERKAEVERKAEELEEQEAKEAAAAKAKAELDAEKARLRAAKTSAAQEPAEGKKKKPKKEGPGKPKLFVSNSEEEESSTQSSSAPQSPEPSTPSSPEPSTPSSSDPPAEAEDSGVKKAKGGKKKGKKSKKKSTISQI